MQEIITPNAEAPVAPLTWKAKFIRRCPKLLCVHIILLLLVSTVWWSLQAIPVLTSLRSYPDLFYGLPHRATQSPLFGRVAIQINGDDEARFVLWMDEEQRQIFNSFFGPGVPLEIIAARSWTNDWVVLGFSSSQAGLDYTALEEQKIRMATTSVIFALFSLILFVLVCLFYLKNYKNRPWLK